MQRALTIAVGLLLGADSLLAQVQLSDAVKDFVRVDAPLIALEHVRVIDGTGAPPAEDQTVVIQNGRIRALGSSASTAAPEGAKALDLSGYAVIPGLVGMHDHLFYPSPHIGGRGVPPVYTELAYSAPRLYLAGGVTSLRTTGSIEPYTDLSLKKLIDSGLAPGPKIHVTGPYLEGSASFTPNLHDLTGPGDAHDGGVLGRRGRHLVQRLQSH